MESVGLDNLPNVLYNTSYLKRKEMCQMNVRLLKAKRVECGLRQKDLASMLGITEKAMNHKECCAENKFKADEMLALVHGLHLTLSEFNSIFFDSNLPFV